MKWCYLLFVLCLDVTTSGQSSFKESWQKLDSMSKTNSAAKHFASLYFSVIQVMDVEYRATDTFNQQLVTRFENVFTQTFIDAAWANNNGKTITPTWQCYFHNNHLQPIQYTLLGINAHINGDYWFALTNSLNASEMEVFSANLNVANKVLGRFFKHLYLQGERDNRNIRRLRSLTFGLYHYIGDHYLIKWRNRQIKLAQFFWKKSPAFTRLHQRIEEKKKRIDRLIIETL